MSEEMIPLKKLNVILAMCYEIQEIIVEQDMMYLEKKDIYDWTDEEKWKYVSMSIQVLGKFFGLSKSDVKGLKRELTEGLYFQNTIVMDILKKDLIAGKS